METSRREIASIPAARKDSRAGRSDATLRYSGLKIHPAARIVAELIPPSFLAVLVLCAIAVRGCAIKEIGVNGNEAGAAEHSGFLPQHSAQRKSAHHHLLAQRRETNRAHPLVR